MWLSSTLKFVVSFVTQLPPPQEASWDTAASMKLTYLESCAISFNICLQWGQENCLLRHFKTKHWN